VAPRHLARSQLAQVVAAPLRVVLGPLVGRLAGVIVVRARRLDLDGIVQARLAHHVPEHSGRGRRAANIAGANEENFHSEASSTPKIFFLSSASRSRAFAASSNSRFFACSSIFFSSSLISRAICFSAMVS